MEMLSLGVNRLVNEADHPSPCDAEFENKYSYRLPPLLLYAFLVCTGTILHVSLLHETEIVSLYTKITSVGFAGYLLFFKVFGI
jgi:hypothetical protein